MEDISEISLPKCNEAHDKFAAYSSIVPAADDNLHKEIIVKRIDWKVADRDDIKLFFQKFGRILSVQKWRLGSNSVAIITFENVKDCCKVLEAHPDELIYKNQYFQVEKAKDNDFLSECSLNSGDGCNVSATSIHSLPNELLDYIFTFLDIQERIQTERVCKRWRKLGTEQPWSEPKCLLFDYWRIDKSSTAGYWPITDNILSAILSRCGVILRSLKLSDRYRCQMPITDKTLDIIGEYCPNITEIDLVLLEFPLSRNCLSKLGESCKKLKVVSLWYNGKEELLLQSFLRQCKGLKSLALSGEKLCPRECDFEVINKNLEVLDLYRCNSLQLDSLYKLMERCDSIQELNLSNARSFEIMTPEVLLKIVHYYCNTLKILKLTCLNNNMIINWCAALSKLYKLEELHTCSWDTMPFQCHSSGNCFDKMSKNIKIFHAIGTEDYFSECFLKKLLSRNDRIQELHLHYCCNLSPDFLKLCLKYTDSMRELDLKGGVLSCKASNWCECFSALRSLERLVLKSCSPEVNDEVAQVIAMSCQKLKILNVGSTAITDAGLSYISSLPFLTQLDISDLGGITNKGIVVLATQGRIEQLNLSKCALSEYDSQITDESCCLLARLCPRFRVLQVERLNISNNLVTAFSEAIQEGYLKKNVVLYVYRTSVTRDCKKNRRLVTLFTPRELTYLAS